MLQTNLDHLSQSKYQNNENLHPNPSISNESQSIEKNIPTSKKELPWKKQFKQNITSLLSKPNKEQTSTTVSIENKKIDVFSPEKQEKKENKAEISTFNYQSTNSLHETPHSIPSLSSKRNYMTNSEYFENYEKDSHKVNNTFGVADYKGIEKERESVARSNYPFELPSQENRSLYENRELERLRDSASHQSIPLSLSYQTKGFNEPSFRSSKRDYLDKEDNFRNYSNSISQKSFHKPNEYNSTSRRHLEDNQSFHSDRSRVGEFLNRYHTTHSDIDFGRSNLFEKVNKENLNFNFSSISHTPTTDKKKAKVSEILVDMKESQQKLKMSYYSYKFDRFKYYLHKVIRTSELRMKTNAFHILVEKSNEIDCILHEFLTQKDHNILSKFFFKWREFKDTRIESKNKDEFLTNKAYDFYEMNLLKKGFDGWLNFYALKESDKEQLEPTKEGIDHFISGLKTKHETKPLNKDLLEIKPYQQKSKREFSKEEGSEEDNVDWGEEKLDNISNKRKNSNERIGENNKSYPKYNNHYSEKPYPPERDHEIYEAEEFLFEEDQISIFDHEMNQIPSPEKIDILNPNDDSIYENNVQDKNREKHISRDGKGNKKNEKGKKINQDVQEDASNEAKKKLTIHELEERARQRKEKLLEIKQKRDEEKLKKLKEKEKREEEEKEIERQKQIDEKRKLEMKKREELEQKRRKELEQLRYEERLEEASVHYKRKLMRSYGIEGFKRLIMERRKKIEMADHENKRSILKRGLYLWKEALEILEREEFDALRGKFELAKIVHERKLKKLGFKAFSLVLAKADEKNKVYRNHRNLAFQKECFKNWVKALPDLRKENYKIQTIEDKLISDYRFKELAMKAIIAWREYVQEEKKVKFKNAQKDYLWNKVNGWLSEYNQKKDSKNSI